MKDLAPDRVLRAVEPIGRDGLVPAVLLSPPPELRWVAVRDLAIAAEYQREISEKSVTLIRRIVAGWDWGRVKALNVRAHDGGPMEVVDGQHTAIAAATHGGIAELPCLVKPAAGLARAAEDFVGLNSMRLAVTPAQRFWASVAAGDPDAEAIVAAAAEAGVRLLRGSANSYHPGDTMAFGALRRVLSAWPTADLARVLTIARAARLAPIKGPHVLAIARLLYAAEYAGTVSDARLIAALSADAAAIEEAAVTARAKLGGLLLNHFATELFRRAA